MLVPGRFVPRMGHMSPLTILLMLLMIGVIVGLEYGVTGYGELVLILVSLVVVVYLLLSSLV